MKTILIWFSVLTLVGINSIYAARNPRLPNILLISLDTVRSDHLSSYGLDRPTTPILDRFSKSSILFSNTISQAPWTLPSHMSVFTGMFPSSHGVDTDGVQLPVSIPTIGELLKKYDYASAGFVSAGYVGSAFGFHRGFDSFVRITNPLEFGTEKITLNGINFLNTWYRDESEKPFFLFLHYLDAHTPYNPPPPLNRLYDPTYQGKMTGWAKDFSRYFNPKVAFENSEDLNHIVALYDGQIRRVDGGLGVVFDKLHELGVYDDTLVIIFSDHGEEFKEHGSMDHGKTLYDEQIKTPLFFSYKQRWNKAQIIDHTVQNIDILPTILKVIDKDIPSNIQGKSLLSIIQPKFLQKLFYSHDESSYSQSSKSNFRVSTVVIDNYKFILKDKPAEIRELYDLKADPLEQHNLVNEQPERAATLYKKLGDWLAQNYISKGQNQPAQMDEETIDHLRKIGYNFAGLSKAVKSSINGPLGLALDPKGRLFLADSLNDQLKVLNSDLKIIATVGSGFTETPWEKGEFHVPSSVCFDSNGFLYVSETGNQRVQCLNQQREFHHFVGEYGDYVLKDPKSIATDPKNAIYVCDPSQRNVFIFDSEGTYLGDLDSQNNPGSKFREPVAITIDAEGTIFVADIGKAVIKRFGSDRTFLNEFEVSVWKPLNNKKKFIPDPALAADAVKQVLYLTDPVNGGIIRFSYDGTKQVRPTQNVIVKVPSGITLSSEGVLYISDYQTNSIVKADVSVFDPKSSPEKK